MLTRLGRLVEARVDELARARGARRRQAAAAGAGRRAGAGALPGVLRRRGRQADRRDHPLSRRLHRLHAARAARRDRPHHPLELSDADHRPLGGGGAGGGQRLRAEAGRGSVPHRARLRAPGRGGRAAGRRAQCRAGARRGGGRGADRASGRRPPLLHRLVGGGAAGAGGGGGERRAGDAGARRQVAAARLRRRRSRRALPLLVNAGIQNAGQTCSAASRILVAARDLRPGGRARWRRATTRSGSARRSTISTSGR